METYEFQRRVLEFFGIRKPMESVHFAMRHYLDHVGRFDHDTVRACIQLAGLFQAYRPSGQPAPEAVDTIDDHLTPERTITNEALIRRIRPWIDLLRKALFGDATVPFTSLTDAVNWLRSVLGQAYDWSPEAATQHLRDEARATVLACLSTEAVSAEIDPAQQLWCLREALTAGVIDVGMRASLAWNEGDPPPKLSPLHECLHAVSVHIADIAEIVGCSEAEVLAYVLADIRPTMPPVTTATRRYARVLSFDTRPIQRMEVTISLKSPITFAEQRALYRQLRKVLNVTKAKPLSAADQEFLTLVARVGEPPAGKGAKAFWESVGQEHHKQGHPKKDWRDLRRKYVRLRVRLEKFAS